MTLFKYIHLVIIKFLSVFFIFSFLFLLIFLFSESTKVYAEWQPIIGIPKPSFGVDEIAPPVPDPWVSGHVGFYYIDETDSMATDIDNPFGFPSQPRKTIPNPILAGSLIEINGSILSQTGPIYVDGTYSNPIFIRSVSYSNKTLIINRWNFQGHYAIIENLHFGPGSTNDPSFGASIMEGTGYIVFRNCEFSGNNYRSGSFSVGSWNYNGSEWAEHIVLDNVYIHDLGSYTIGVDNDVHGVVINGSVRYFWLINSELYNNDGDGIQIEARNGRMDKINNIFVGNTISHKNKQAGMWIKHAKDVIFSQNIIYDHISYDQYSSGQGTGWQYDNDFIWIIFNTIYDCEQGIAVESIYNSSGDHHYILGNLIYNIQSHNQSNPHNYGAIKLRGRSGISVVNNTIYNYDAGLSVLYDNFNLTIANNIWAGRKNVSVPMWYFEGNSTMANAVIRNNLFDGLRFKIYWNFHTYTNLISYQSMTSKCLDCFSVDPNFTDAENNNFTLNYSSDAIDNGFIETIYDLFFYRYGINISKDINHVERPQGQHWDIGAFEYVLQAPLSPGNFRLIE